MKNLPFSFTVTKQTYHIEHLVIFMTSLPSKMLWVFISARKIWGYLCYLTEITNALPRHLLVGYESVVHYGALLVHSFDHMPSENTKDQHSFHVAQVIRNHHVESQKKRSALRP